MLKCLPSKAAHCSSLKSFFCLEQGSELQERNFIRRPTQYVPPFLGLRVKTWDKSSKTESFPCVKHLFSEDTYQFINFPLFAQPVVSF